MSRTVGTTNEKVARDELAIIDFMLSHKGIDSLKNRIDHLKSFIF